MSAPEDQGAPPREALEKELRSLRKQLERSERFRARTESLKEQNDLLLRNVIADLRSTQEQLEEAKAELVVRVAERTRELVVANAELQREIEARSRLNDELAAARDAAVAANRAKSAFLATMSHELRTPLNVIIGHAEMIHETAVEESLTHVAADVDPIHSAAIHLLSIINDILDLAKIEAGSVTLYEESVDLSAMAADLAVTMQLLVARGGNRLILALDRELGSIRADRLKLRQTLYNLLSNACKFTRDGTITLSGRREGAWVELAVADTGIGIPADKIGRLFQPFSQVDSSSTREHAGTGLGLVLCRRFAQMMGGTVSVLSEAGVGSTFTLRLPVG